MGIQEDSKELHWTTFRTWIQNCQMTPYWKISVSSCLAASYRKEIKQWPQIKAGDAGAHRRFQNYENIDHLQSLNVLNTPDIIWMLLSKLSGNVRDNWSRALLTIWRKGNREREMADFI